VAETGVSDFTTSSNEKHQRLFQRGVKLIGAGALLLVSSFAINFLLQSNPSFIPIMYVMTTLGATCMIKGLVDVLG
jgi:hypothetical protein